MTEDWKIKFQLVPTDIHLRNSAEQSTQTFKDHFITILAGVAPGFPRYLWDHIFPQAELLLNLLCQSTLNPKMLSWEYFNGPFDYDTTPLSPLGCPVIIHKKLGNHNSWDLCSKDEFSAGVSLEHYRYQRAIDSKTKAIVVSNNVDVCHHSITTPNITDKDRVTHSLKLISHALQDAPDIS